MEEGFPICAKGLVQAIIGAGGFVLEDVTVNTGINEIKLAIDQRNGSSAGAASAIESKRLFLHDMQKYIIQIAVRISSCDKSQGYMWQRCNHRPNG